MFIIISVISIGFLIFFVASVPPSNLLSLRTIPAFIVPPLAIFGIGSALITERRKILFQIERDYPRTCKVVEEILKKNSIRYKRKVSNIPIINTSTKYELESPDFKINVGKSAVNLLNIKMSPIETFKVNDKFIEEQLMENIKEI
jgi:hypothetical protein